MNNSIFIQTDQIQVKTKELLTTPDNSHPVLTWTRKNKQKN